MSDATRNRFVREARGAITLESLESRRMFAGTIGGTVFDDSNGNGVRESGETGLANQTVFIDADLDGVRDASELSAVTNSTGRYTFANLAPGVYRVRHAAPAGRRLTAPVAIFSDVRVPQRTETAFAPDFGNSTMAVVRGTIFRDDNGDGQKQSNEPGLPNWRVFCDKDGDGVYDPGIEKTRLTNSRGEYRFADLTPGLYTIRIVQQAGFQRINPLNGMFKVTITNGISFSNRNFAEKPIV